MGKDCRTVPDVEGYSHWSASNVDCVDVHAHLLPPFQGHRGALECGRGSNDWLNEGNGFSESFLKYLPLYMYYILMLFIQQCISVYIRYLIIMLYVISWVQLSSALQFLDFRKRNLSDTDLLWMTRDSKVNKKWLNLEMCVCVCAYADWLWLSLEPWC